MDTFLYILYLSIGLAMLYKGADWLVQGSAQIALRLGMAPLVVGLTIVAFATSSPELFVCVTENLAGDPDVSVENVLGSNICNIALILGVAALIRPIKIRSEIVRREMPILILVSGLFVWMLWDYHLELWEGIVLTAGIVAYLCMNLYLAKREKISPEIKEEFEHVPGQAESEADKSRTMPALVGLIFFSLLVLIGGTQLLLHGGENIALSFGVSEALIAATIYAFGTSLPELATSIIASLKNQGDIITGNALGSCVFNILAVMGITTLVLPMHLTEMKELDLWTMLGVTLVLFPLMWTRGTLSRWEGGLLLIGYLVYLGFRFQMG